MARSRSSSSTVRVLPVPSLPTTLSFLWTTRYVSLGSPHSPEHWSACAHWWFDGYLLLRPCIPLSPAHDVPRPVPRRV